MRQLAHVLPDMFHLARPGRIATHVLWATAPSPMAVRYAWQVLTKELRVRLHAQPVALVRTLLRVRLLAPRARCTRTLPSPGYHRALLVLQAPPPQAPEQQPVSSAMPERTARPVALHARPAQLARTRRLVHPLARHALQGPTLWLRRLLAHLALQGHPRVQELRPVWHVLRESMQELGRLLAVRATRERTKRTVVPRGAIPAQEERTTRMKAKY